MLPSLCRPCGAWGLLIAVYPGSRAFGALTPGYPLEPLPGLIGRVLEEEIWRRIQHFAASLCLREWRGCSLTAGQGSCRKNFMPRPKFHFCEGVGHEAGSRLVSIFASESGGWK